MKQIFKDILTKSNEVPELVWVDKDKGQLDQYDIRPQVPSHSCLIRFDTTGIFERGDGKQKRDLRITLRLVFDFMGENYKGQSDEALDQSLAYFDVVEKVEATFNLWESATFNEWAQVGNEEELRQDGIMVTNLYFETSYIYEAGAE